MTSNNVHRRDGIGVVVIGGDYQGLGIVRSLGRHGIPVRVIDDERSIACYSRYTTVAQRVPSLLAAARDYATWPEQSGAHDAIWT